jgi:hypothetical protein
LENDSSQANLFGVRMTERNSRARLVERRGELLAELFLQELEPAFLTRATPADFTYDFLVGFTNTQKGVNTFGVKLKATERPVPSRAQLSPASFERLTHSNIPILLLVVDVKRNELYCAWLRSGSRIERTRTAVSVPVAKVDEAMKRELLRQLKSGPQPTAVLGVG